jgi:RNA-binding protein YhbY
MVQVKETLRVGKSGVTATLIQELKDQLKKRKQVTVKFMSNSVVDQKDFLLLAEKLANESNSSIVHKVGHTATYLKK